MKNYASEKPNARVNTCVCGMPQTTLNYLVKLTSAEEIEALAKKEGADPTPEYFAAHKYCYYSVALAPGVEGRDAEINAIITDQYPLDKMQAVQNNYFADPTDAENLEEMNTMQEWRKYAKKFADGNTD